MVVEKDSLEWNKSLIHFDHSLFITSEWLEALADEFCQPVYFDFVKGSEVVAKIAGLTFTQSFWKGRVLYIYGGLAMVESDNSIYDSCFFVLYKYCEAHGFNRIEIKSLGQPISFPVKNRFFYKTEMLEFITDFPKDESGIRYNRNFKRNLKKSKEHGGRFRVVTEPGLEQELRHLMIHTLSHRVKKNYKDYNPFYLKNLSLESVRRLLANGLGRFYLIEDEQGLQGIQLSLEKDGKAYGLLLGAGPLSYQNGYRQLLDYQIMESLASRRYQYYNMGSVSSGPDGEGLAAYKLSAGASAHVSYGVYTHFMQFPQRLLNPLYGLGYILLNAKWVVAARRLFIWVTMLLFSESVLEYF